MNIEVLIPHNSDRDLFLTEPVIRRLEQLGSVGFNEAGRQYTEAELVKTIRRADVLVSGWNCPKITRELERKNTASI